MNLPSVSVLIAARNEENNIAACLYSILACDYPANLLQIWVADDNSEDATPAIVRQISTNYPQISLHTVSGTLGNAKGKANALAQLAHLAKGDYWLITDADVRVNPAWIKGMITIAIQKPTIGVVTGFTIPQGGSSWLEYMQGLDWFCVLHQIKSISDMGFPVTSMGNNMLVSAEAYRATGGYEQIPFSLTEDYELFKHILAKGFDYRNADEPSVLAYTFPIKGFLALVRQRKRWFYGAVRLPYYMKIVMILQGLRFMLLWFLLLMHPTLGMVFWAAIVLWRSVFLIPKLIRCNQTKLLPALFMYDLYVSLVYSAMIIGYVFFPVIEWKGRKYQTANP